jgi:hypothetical protein
VADATPPALSIVSPTNSQRWSNVVFVVTGTASDNVGLVNVRCQVNGGGWTNAVGATNWTASVSLTPGTNTVKAFAVDTSGQASPTSTVSFVYATFTPVIVRTNGKGSVTPNYNGQALEIWKTYSMTASAGSGFSFTNWTGGTNLPFSVLTNGTTLKFVMQSNLTLQANFLDVTKPTVTITTPTANQRLTNALAIVKGTAADNGQVASVWYQLNTNQWALATGTTNWQTVLGVPAGTHTVRVFAVDAGGNKSTTNSVSFVATNSFLLRLGFNSTQPLTQTGLVLRLDASLSLNGRIEASTNLATWTSLTNFVSTNSTLLFRDPAVTNLSRRFYRAVAP